MPHRNSVHDLKSLVLSFHSLIAIETVEEERVRSLLREVATDLRLPVFEWSISSGLSRLNGAAIGETHDPLPALKHIATIDDTDAIYLLKDLTPHLTNPNIARALRELVQKLMATRSAIVLTGDPIDLPKDMDALAVRFDLEMPDESELREAIRSVVDSMSVRQHVAVELSRQDAQRLVQALSGLTLNQARRSSPRPSSWTAS
jgi:hypothetical protein